MRRHLSVLMLIARSTIYKLLGLLVLMVCAEGALYYVTLKKILTDGSMFSVEELISNSHIIWVFAVFFVIITILLCLTGCEYGSKQGYKLRRLRISERSIFLWQSIYNIFCYLVIWAVQLGTGDFFTDIIDPEKGRETYIILKFQNFFKIPVLEDQHMKITIDKGYNGNMTGSQGSSENSNIYYMQSQSVITEDACKIK